MITQDNLWNLLEEEIAFILEITFCLQVISMPELQESLTISNITQIVMSLFHKIMWLTFHLGEHPKTHINNYGRLLLRLCVGSELRIVNGRRGSDQGMHWLFYML